MRRRQLLVAAFAAPWSLWALVRALGLDAVHPVVAALAFTPLVAATAALPLVAALLARAWAVAAVAAAALVALVLAVAPRALDGPRLASPDTSGRPLVVMTANLLFGGADADAVMRLVREHDVDVLSLQELTVEAAVRLDRAGARERLPERLLRPGPRASGTGLMARAPLRPLPADRPVRGRWLPAALSAPGAAPLRIVAVHPYPPISGRALRAWRTVLRSLPAPRRDGRATILAGDFNATLDQRALRRVLRRGYVDAADATGDGLRATFPARGLRPGIAIDHVLVPAGVGVRRVSVHDVAGSDHRALVAELVVPAA